MKTLVKFFSSSNSSKLEDSINTLAKEQNLEIVSANSCVCKGVVYTTVVFAQEEIAEAPKPRTRAKKESEQ